MITENTLFILGAGASWPYGYPTGEGLRDYISSDEFSSQYAKLLHKKWKKSKQHISIKEKLIEEARHFTDTFKSAYPKQIDFFLYHNDPIFNDIGKFAIVAALHHYEKGSLFGSEMIEEKKREQDWYGLLFDRITDGFSPLNDYKQVWLNKIKFITFNYDRSLEHRLYTNITSLFYKPLVYDRSKNQEIGLHDGTTNEDILPFQIEHIYGMIDKPDWSNGHSYKEELSYDTIHELKNNIKVIGEERKDTEQSEKIKDMFTWAQKVFFLGFGYADENLSSLGWPVEEWKGKKFFGTAYNVREEKDIVRLKNKLIRGITRRDRFPQNSPMPSIILENVDCYSLLDKHLR